MTLYPTDTELIQMLHDNNTQAFEAVYRRYHQGVFKNIRKLIPNQQEAEDILQEVFITLWQKRHEITVEHSVAGWLFTTSYYKSLEQLKRNIKLNIQQLTESHTELFSEPFEGLNTETDYIEKVSALTLAIDQLPPQKKLAFKLFKIEGKSYNEVATTLNISVDTAKEYVKTATKLLRQTTAANKLATSTIAIVALYVFLEN